MSLAVPSGRCHTPCLCGISSRSCSCSTPPAARSRHRRYRYTGQTGAGLAAGWQKPPQNHPQNAGASPTGQHQRPAGTPPRISQTGTQKSDTGGSGSAISLRQASQFQPLSLIFSLARCLVWAAAFCFTADKTLRIEGRCSLESVLAVNSRNARSRLSASLALKITT